MTAAMICCVVLVAGCQTMTGDFCDLARPRVHGNPDLMSDAALIEFITHNEKGERLCGWEAVNAR